MKRNDNKFLVFVRDNYKIFIPIALMIVLFVGFFVYYKVVVSNVVVDEVSDNFYQYFYGVRYDYEGVVGKNRKGEIVSFSPLDIDINLDSTPIYYRDSDVVIFFSDMSVVMPTLNCSEYLDEGISYVEFRDNIYNLTSNNYSDALGHYFLFDGDDLYFFIESVVLKVGDEEIELSALSYVVAEYGSYISYYDYESDTFGSIDVSGDDSVVVGDYYNIYVSRDIIDYYGMDVILSGKISELNTIDKKG